MCTGSQEVAFIRSTNEFIGLKILVPAGGEDDFEFTGNSTLINANQFSNVLARMANGNTPTSPPRRLYRSYPPPLVQLDLQFPLGIINGGASSGTRYGYFSNYAAQAYIVQVDDNTLCEGMN